MAHVRGNLLKPAPARSRAFGKKVLGLVHGSGARGWGSCTVKLSEGEIEKSSFAEIETMSGGGPPGLGGGATGGGGVGGFGDVGEARLR